MYTETDPSVPPNSAEGHSKDTIKLYPFPVAAVTKDDKVGGLKQQKCIISQF